MTLQFVRTKNTETAFAAAMTFLAARDPFRTMPLGPICDSVSGSIRRGHYVLAVDDGRVVGLTCWAVTDYDTARRWTAGEITPGYDQALEGDTVVLQLGGGESPEVALGGIRHIADLYPGRRYLMNRLGRASKRTKAGRFPKAKAAVVTTADAGQAETPHATVASF